MFEGQSGSDSDSSITSMIINTQARLRSHLWRATGMVAPSIFTDRGTEVQTTQASNNGLRRRRTQATGRTSSDEEPKLPLSWTPPVPRAAATPLGSGLREAQEILGGEAFEDLPVPAQRRVENALSAGLVNDWRCPRETGPVRVYGVRQLRPVRKPPNTELQDMLIMTVIQMNVVFLHMVLFNMALLLYMIGADVPFVAVTDLSPLPLMRQISGSWLTVQWKCMQRLLRPAPTSSSGLPAAGDARTLAVVSPPWSDRLIYFSQCLVREIYRSPLPAQVQQLVRLLYKAADYIQDVLGYEEGFFGTPIHYSRLAIRPFTERRAHIYVLRFIGALWEALLAAVDTYRYEAHRALSET